MIRVPVAPQPHQHLVLSDVGHSKRHVVLYHCCFNWLFLMALWRGASFHMLISHLFIFFGVVSIKVFGPFSNRICHCIIITSEAKSNFCDVAYKAIQDLMCHHNLNFIHMLLFYMNNNTLINFSSQHSSKPESLNLLFSHHRLIYLS